MAGLPSGPVYVDHLLQWSGKIQDPGSSGEMHLGTYSFRPCNAALLLEAGSTVAALEACELLH